MRFIAALFLAVFVLAVAGVTFVYSGLYNIAASTPHFGPVAWLFHTTKHSSIERRADEGEAPESFSEEQVRQGAREFAETCVHCHGGPGVERTDWAKGLLPPPPDLEHSAEHWGPAELAWIVEHGIKMTGMPAFGQTHGEEEIWAVVAFLEQLPGMTPERFQQLGGQSRQSAAAGGRP